MAEPLLVVEGLSKRFLRGRETIPAVEKISFDVQEGETFALAGRSGSGKTTVARLVAQLIRPDSGIVRFLGEDWSELSSEQVRRRRRHLQMVFQDPYSAFNPRTTVAKAISDPLRLHHIVQPADRLAEVGRLLERVGLDQTLMHFPVLRLSGGQRQRVAIARAIASRPKLIILDEATSALDMTIRAEILRLLLRLQLEDGLAYLMVSHDLALVRAVAHRVAILSEGRIVETGSATQVIDTPRSDLAKALVAAIPRVDFDT